MSKKTPKYFRVGDDYFVQVKFPKSDGTIDVVLMPRKRLTIIDDHGKEFFSNIPKYLGWCNVPDYKNGSNVVNGFYNLFNPLAYDEEQGDYPTILQLLKHVFDEQIEMGLDYVQLLYEKPRQILPVLCIVSAAQGTGKTTFVNFLSWLFEGNVAIISNEDIEGNFNQHYATKHIIALDESDLHKQRNTSKIKQIATQKSIFRKGKFQNEQRVDFFGKLIILSNNERGFINVKNEDVRYWIMKIKPFEGFDPDFEDKLKKEIPAFLYFLNRRKMVQSKALSRAWFSFEVIETDALNEAKSFNKTTLYHEILNRLDDYFSENSANEICLTTSLIKDKLLPPNAEYSSKYITKVMTEEFYLTSLPARRASPWDLTNKNGRWWIISRELANKCLNKVFSNSGVAQKVAIDVSAERQGGQGF